MSQVYHGRGYVYSIQYHIVWCVKYRHKILNTIRENKLKEILNKIAKDNQFTILLVNGDLDHIHLLIECSPQHYIPDIMKALKGVSARLMMKQYPQLKRKLWGGHLWNPSYFVATVSENTEEQIRNYINSQKEKIESEVNLSMKIVIKGFKYRIYPTQYQKIQLAKTFGCVRFVYNQLLAKRIDLYKTEQKSISKTDCNNYCNRELKKQYLWLKEVDKFALTNSIYDLDSAYQNFFREIKKGNKNQGFPKFKSKRDHHYSYKTNFTNNNIKVDYENNRIQLPKLKWIKAKLHREFKGKILFATISKTPSNKYFVSFNVEVEHEVLLENSNMLGFDLGIKEFIIDTNGTHVDNPRVLKQYEEKINKITKTAS